MYIYFYASAYPNEGAKLEGGFSRFDYQMKRVPQTPSFRSLKAYLPKNAHNIYYRDQIGESWGVVQCGNRLDGTC
jgi:Ribophorin I